nr:MAG: ORF1 [Torque teno midi virus]
MPFWWNRRKRFWYGRRRYRRRFQRYKTRKPRRRFTRRRNRRTTYRRRKRRRYKVRRKLKKIAIKQWQPESINKCKIKGFSTLVLGAEGRQYLCWTNESDEYIQPKAPGGGQFGCEAITLEWLYEQYRAHTNIWTRSNKNKDLCRYTGCTITLFRHPEIDFIFAYNIQPPFHITKFTYTDIHPINMLLRPHVRLILSKASKPNAKNFVKVRIKPPKQMSTKWFFQKEFSDKTLVVLQATACTLRYPRISPLTQSQMVSIYYLNTDFFPYPNWGKTINQAWSPYPTKRPSDYEFYSKPDWTGPSYSLKFDGSSEAQYYESIHHDTGWFQSKVLQSASVKVSHQQYGSIPINVARYNPNMDTGIGNSVYVISVLSSSYKPPLADFDYKISGMPIWMALFGFWSYLKYTTKDKGFMEHYMFILESPAIHPISQTSKQTIFPFVDLQFIQGKLPFDEYLSENIKKFWYPKATFQTVTINSLVESGPFIQRLGNITNSTWELPYKYKFYFKWGGPQVHDQPVDDPKYQQDYPTPSAMQEAIQISNPKKLSTETLFHDWDYRRGFITQTALKRMSEHIETDTDFQSDDSGTPRKRRKVSKELPCLEKKEEKIHQCLQELFKESSCQETPETLEQLIKYQQQQQNKLKHNILHLLTHLKQQQRFLSLQTGALE